jgi:hypothetical protein
MRSIMVILALIGLLGVSTQAQDAASSITATHVIAYVAQVENTARAFIVDADGLMPQEIAPSAAFVRWSWDGKQLLVVPSRTQTAQLFNTTDNTISALSIPADLPADSVLLNVLPTWYRQEWVLHIADAKHNTFYHAVPDETGAWQYEKMAEFPSNSLSVQMGDLGFHREARDMLALLKLTGQGVSAEILTQPTNGIRPIEGLPARRMISVLGFAPDGVHLALAEHDVTKAETRLYYVTVPPEVGQIEAKAPAAMLTNAVQILDAAYVLDTSVMLMSMASAPPSTNVALIEWDTSTNALALVALEHSTNGIFDVSPDGAFIVMGGTDGELWRLERATGTMTLLAQTQDIYAVDWRPAKLD